MCNTATSSTGSFDFACLTAAFASIDPYCNICEPTSSHSCHYPAAFVYHAGGHSGTVDYCPAGVTASNIGDFHSLPDLLHDPAFYNLGYSDTIPPA